MWIFGYGSLIWKVDFPYEEKLVGYVKGFNRRFYQHSTDHRGTPEKDEVWGVAYKIGTADIEHVVNHLDFREKGGYQRKQINFNPRNVEIAPFEITIYVGTSDNFQFAGEADLDSIALQIYSSIGPSGTNIEYICNLAKAMREIAPHVHDAHLFNLEQKVIRLIKNN